MECTITVLTRYYCFLLQTGRKEKGDPLNSAIDKMTKKTRDLRRQVSACFLLHLNLPFKHCIYTFSKMMTQHFHFNIKTLGLTKFYVFF